MTINQLTERSKEKKKKFGKIEKLFTNSKSVNVMQKYSQPNH